MGQYLLRLPYYSSASWFPFDVLVSFTIFLIEFNRNEIEGFDVEEARVQ